VGAATGAVGFWGTAEGEAAGLAGPQAVVTNKQATDSAIRARELPSTTTSSAIAHQ